MATRKLNGPPVSRPRTVPKTKVPPETIHMGMMVAPDPITGLGRVVDPLVIPDLKTLSAKTLCGAEDKISAARSVTMSDTIKPVTCKACLQLYEDANYDQLYGTSPAEDDTTP